MSLKVFRSFVLRQEDNTFDASQIHSLACFQAWQRARKPLLEEKEEEANEAVASDVEYRRFYRALTNHVSGVDGRSPFPLREEEAVLDVLRERAHWPCFPSHIKLGESGLRAQGFHGKQSRKRLRTAPPAAAAAAATTNPDLSAEELRYVNSLVGQFPRFITSFRNFTLDVWAKCIDILRLICLAKSPSRCIGKHFPDDYADQLCDARAQLLGALDFVMVYDSLATDYSKRILSQNALAKHYFGDMVLKMDRMLIHKDEVTRVLFGCFWVMHRPGVDYLLPGLKMVCRDGRTRRFDVKFWICPEIYFMMAFSGRILDGEEE